MSKARDQRLHASIEAAKREKNRKILIAVAVVLAAAIIVTPLAMFSSGAFYRVATAMTVDGTKYSVADFNYYYNTALQAAYTRIYSSYGEYANTFLDPSSPLDEQSYSADKTWHEYLCESAVETMRSVVMLNDEAEANGYTLSEEQQKEFDDTIAQTYAVAKNYGYSVDGYLQAIYGTGMNRSVFERNYREAFLAEKYGNEVLSGLSYTDEDLAAAYEADRNSFDFVSYRIYAISGEAGEGEDATATMAAAKEQADEMAARVNAGEEFVDVICDFAPEELKESYADPAYTLAANADYNSVKSTIYGEWLFDTARVDGELKVFEVSAGYTLIQFLGREDNDYNSRDFRRIFVMAEADEEGNVSEDAMAAAETEAKEILLKWQNGDATAESFAALADERSDDTTREGGLYENIRKYQTEDILNDWLYSELQPGDTAVLEESELGYHIVYYVGEHDNVRAQLVENSERSSDYNAWVEESIADYAADTNTFGYRFVGNI